MKTINSFQGQYRFLSNFFPCSVTLGGMECDSVEHAYQAAKTLDPDNRLFVLHSPTAGIAKRRGKTVQLRPDWEQVKEQIMLDLLREKFSNTTLAYGLLQTGEAELVEGNTWGDTYWGVCRGVGQNRLGMLLMQVRSELARLEV